MDHLSINNKIAVKQNMCSPRIRCQRLPQRRALAIAAMVFSCSCPSPSLALQSQHLPGAEFSPVRPLTETKTSPILPLAHIFPPSSSSSSLFPNVQPHVSETATDKKEPAAISLAAEEVKTKSKEDEEKSSWELKVGKALDTLRSDYPYILTDQPDFTIFDKDVEIVDPSGVTVHGLSTYKNSFRLLHALIVFLYCPQRSGLTFRMCYDKARRNIRIHWNAHVVPREIFGGGSWRGDLYVDGISVYELNPETGLIVQHRIEQLLFNNMPVRPKEGVIAALTDKHTVSVPSFSKGLTNSVASAQHTVLEFSPLLLPRPRLQLPGGGTASSLFALETSSGGGGGPTEASTGKQDSSMDWAAFENKNKSRKKFGLKPLTPEEFLELEAQVRVMTQAHRAQHKAAMQSAAEVSSKKQTPKSSFFDKLFGALQDTCESNFDCERPEVCCDFGFKKMCCASGTPVINGFTGQTQWQPALVPVPVENYPPGQGPNDYPRNY